MAGLKELRNRLESIKSTQKITSAMKLVAASRLHRAQLLLDRSADYSRIISTAVKRLVAAIKEEENEKGISYLPPLLLRQKPNAQSYLLSVFTSDRGLCGSYNQNVGREATRRVDALLSQGKDVKIICFGKKGFNILKRRYENLISENRPAIAPDLTYATAKALQEKIKDLAPDVCEIVYGFFRSALNREMRSEQVFPIPRQVIEPQDGEHQLTHVGNAYYDYKPDSFSALETLLHELQVNLIFQTMMNALASEHGARMVAMDNATGNAKDMIGSLTLKYNSIRQSAITTELTEIISGAEAL